MLCFHVTIECTVTAGHREVFRAMTTVSPGDAGVILLRYEVVGDGHDEHCHELLYAAS